MGKGKFTPCYSAQFLLYGRICTLEEGRIADGSSHYLQSQGGRPPTPKTAEHPVQPSSSASSGARPLPYSFLPTYLPSPAYRDPPTPTSLAGSTASPSPSVLTPAREYFDSYVERTLQGTLPTPPASGKTINPTNNTPNLSRALAKAALTPEESPDPLAIGPSPTKRRKSSADLAGKSKAQGPSFATLPRPKARHREETPTPSHSRTLKPQLSPRKIVEVVIPSRKLPISGSSDTAEKEESEEDELDWDDARDADGDWSMGSKLGTPRPPQAGPSASRGHESGRTGERDMRSQSHDSLMAGTDER